MQEIPPKGYTLVRREWESEGSASQCCRGDEGGPSEPVCKFNHALSESSLGQFYDGGYTEAVLGYGYRPVAHDRLNALAKS